MSDEHPTLDDRGREDRREPPALIGDGSPGRMPKQVGRYHVKRLIATGGMGAVYEAVQDRPRRTVALKLMRIGISSRSALRRFEYESQLLARLRHPCIAEVYDSGTHDEGEGGMPWFAMEYISGARTITAYVREKGLSTRQRLEMFMKVCQAVHHGHTRGIIHRDLKPDNILVDSHGQIKVIDFGVARATDSDLAVTTLQTNVGQLVGTVQYMSPEQIDAEPHDLDTRSDVYSLGVILYELLCDNLPYDVSQTKVYEATRIVREQAPMRISTVNSTLKGDVETIVLKALEKDRDRRYQSAQNLADDIQRYLNDEPITARPPSLAYQMRIFARRHKPVLAGVAAVFAALLVGLIVSLFLYFDARSARHHAETMQGAAESAKTLAQDMLAQKVASEQAAVAEAVKATTALNLIQRMFGEDEDADDLPDAVLQEGQYRTVRETLDEFAGKLRNDGGYEPGVAATLHSTVGRAYMRLGMDDKAEPHLNRALELNLQVYGPSHAATAESKVDYGRYLARDSETRDAAKATLAEAMAAQRQLFGERSEPLAETMRALALAHQWQREYEQAEKLTRDALAMLKQLLGEEHVTTQTAMDNLASVLKRNGTDAGRSEAEALYRRGLATRLSTLGPAHARTNYAVLRLTWLLIDSDRPKEGLDVLRQHVQRLLDTVGQEHLDTCAMQLELAGVLWKRGGKPGEVHALYTNGLPGVRRHLGDANYLTMKYMGSARRFYEDIEDYSREEALLRDLAAASRRRYGENDDRTMDWLGALAWFLSYRGDQAEQGVEIRRIILGHYLRTQGEQDARTLLARRRLAEALEYTGENEEAEQHARIAAEGHSQSLGSEAEETLRSRFATARLMVTNGNVEQGVMEMKAIAEASRRVNVPGHWLTGQASMQLVGLYSTVAMNAELRTAALRQLVEERGAYIENDNLGVVTHLANRLRYLGMYREAELVYQDLIAARTAKLGADHDNTLFTMRGLALTYIESRQYDKAEQKLEEILSHREPGDLAAVAVNQIDTERLIQVMLLNGKAGEAAEVAQSYLASLREASLPENSGAAVNARILVALTMLAAGRYDDGAQVIDPLVVAADAAFTEDDIRRIYAHLLRGVALAGRKDYTAAENELAANYQPMMQEFGGHTPVVALAMSHLAEVYRQTNRPEDAQRMQRQHNLLTYRTTRVESLVNQGVMWRYLDDGSDQGIQWRSPTFDDAGWPQGAAPLGYGEEDIATLIGYGKDSNNKHRTTYFRHAFDLSGDPSRYTALRVRLRRDDGAAVYLNGQEIVRNNLAAGAGYRHFTPGTAAGIDEQIYFVFVLDASLLQPGRNVLAVEVHQVNARSSDLAFDLSLEGLVADDAK